MHTSANQEGSVQKKYKKDSFSRTVIPTYTLQCVEKGFVCLPLGTSYGLQLSGHLEKWHFDKSDTFKVKKSDTLK